MICTMSNSQASPDFEFDVAFSFHSKDEALAMQLNDALQDRFRTFIYSEHQKSLAGRDGEIAFGEVFAKKARVVVVLYRDEWGQTPFTRIEETAIRGRAFNEGYDFTLFVPTDGGRRTPQWLPKTRLYMSLDRGGIVGTAAVIESKVQEAGGSPAPESAADRASRLKRHLEFQKTKKMFRSTAEAVTQANASFEELVAAMEQTIAAIKQQNEMELSLKRHHSLVLIYGLGPAAQVSWHHSYTNDLTDSSLSVEIFGGLPYVAGLTRGFPGDKPSRLSSIALDFELLRAGETGYVMRDVQRQEFSVATLAEKILKDYFDASERHKRS
jgi:hypothetical protein